MELKNVYIINLERDKHKWELVTKELDKYNIKYNRFNAVYGKDLSEEQINEYVDWISRNFILNNGQIGCVLSHVNLLKQLVNDDNQDFYLILEDDIEILDYDKILTIYNLYKNKKIDIDFLSMKCMEIEFQCSRNGDRIKINEGIEIEEKLIPMGTSSYFVTKEGAKKFLKQYNKVKYPIDFQYYIWGKKYYKYYHTSKDLIQTKGNIRTESNIANNNKMVSMLFTNPDIKYYINYPGLTLFRRYPVTFVVLGFLFISLIFLIFYLIFRNQYLLILFIIFLLLGLIFSI
jgi:glycosyl transferase, family 25